MIVESRIFMKEICPLADLKCHTSSILLKIVSLNDLYILELQISNLESVIPALKRRNILVGGLVLKTDNCLQNCKLLSHNSHLTPLLF